MVEYARKQFNEAFTEETFQQMVRHLHPKHSSALDFRIAETPVFVSRAFRAHMMRLFEDVTSALQQPGFADRMKQSIPPHLFVPNTSQMPTFLAIDFAVAKDPATGELIPQLIELQGVASLYCYQRNLSNAYREFFNISPELEFLYDGMDDAAYLQLLRQILIGQEDPENVVLLEIRPRYQKTRIDFWYTWKDLGIRPVCVTDVVQQGRKLFYKKAGGRLVPIHRIYNRVIFDELERRTDIRPGLNFSDELDVEWHAHPNWFFMASKYTVPFLKSPYVPQTHFLHELTEIPTDLSEYVLKPLFSFAGAGVIFDVTRQDVEAVWGRNDYILMRKVHYVPFIPTPDDPAKAEIRMMCVWDGQRFRPVINLARLSKGKILGVDFNKARTWVGGSAVLMERE